MELEGGEIWARPEWGASEMSPALRKVRAHNVRMAERQAACRYGRLEIYPHGHFCAMTFVGTYEIDPATRLGPVETEEEAAQALCAMLWPKSESESEGEGNV